LSAVSFKQELVGLLGQPVAENPTQAMVEAAFRSLDLDWRYLTLEVAPDALGDAVRGARAFGFRGFHCTIPHKVAVVPHLDRLGESASAIGAVNCVVRRGDDLVGENTDGKGFLRSLEERLDPRGAAVVVLGAGGAARAIAVELGLAGVGRLMVANRSEERGRELARAVGGDFVLWRGDCEVPAGTDVLVNATSIGLHPEVDERVPVAFAAPLLVADVIPNPPETRLLRDAAAMGCETLDGLGMLVEQGVLAVEYWTGRRPDPAVMRDALSDVL
jgi:shikimate dehydrogenase